MQGPGWARWALLGVLLIFGLLGGFGTGYAVQHDQLTQEQIDELHQETEGALEQISEALTRTLFAWDFLQRGDGESAKTFAHEVLNIIEGPQGEHYDPAYAGPVGDGVGGLTHAERLHELLKGLPQGGDYVIASENVVLFLKWAVGNVLSALERFEADRIEAIKALRRAQGMLMAARGSREEMDRPTQGSARAILAWLDELR